MKKYQILILAAVISNCGNIGTKSNNKNGSSIIIDTVKVKEISFENICFMVEESNYPKITGFDDKIFEKQVNDIFVKNFNSYIDLKKQEYKSPCKDDGSIASITPGAVSSWFEILTLTDNLISIVQHLYFVPGGGGNLWIPDSKVTTINYKDRIIYNSKNLGISFSDVDFINKKIKLFFYLNFIEEASEDEIGYPIIKTQSEFDELEFGIRNDSIVLIIAFTPTNHASCSNYIIPIKQWEK